MELWERAHKRNPHAEVVVTDSVVTVAHPEVIRGKRVVTVDDGPTLTHGGMATGAGDFPACPFCQVMLYGSLKSDALLVYLLPVD